MCFAAQLHCLRSDGARGRFFARADDEYDNVQVSPPVASVAPVAPPVERHAPPVLARPPRHTRSVTATAQSPEPSFGDRDILYVLVGTVWYLATLRVSRDATTASFAFHADKTVSDTVPFPLDSRFLRTVKAAPADVNQAVRAGRAIPSDRLSHSALRGPAVSHNLLSSFDRPYIYTYIHTHTLTHQLCCHPWG